MNLIETLHNFPLLTLQNFSTFMEADDMGEDAAALALAKALAGPDLALGTAFTGRCNLFATERGLIVPDQERIDRINLIDEGMTIGTLAPYSQVEAGQMVASDLFKPAYPAPRKACSIRPPAPSSAGLRYWAVSS